MHCLSTRLGAVIAVTTTTIPTITIKYNVESIPYPTTGARGGVVPCIINLVALASAAHRLPTILHMRTAHLYLSAGDILNGKNDVRLLSPTPFCVKHRAGVYCHHMSSVPVPSAGNVAQSASLCSVRRFGLGVRDFIPGRFYVHKDCLPGCTSCVPFGEHPAF